jgi:hypothetical protein
MSFNLTKYLSKNPLLQEAEKILTPRRSKEERDKNYVIATQQKYNNILRMEEKVI